MKPGNLENFSSTLTTRRKRSTPERDQVSAVDTTQERRIEPRTLWKARIT
jgi:hypothetical protein